MTAIVDFVTFVALCMVPGFLGAYDSAAGPRQGPEYCRNPPARAVPADPASAPVDLRSDEPLLATGGLRR